MDASRDVPKGPRDMTSWTTESNLCGRCYSVFQPKNPANFPYAEMSRKVRPFDPKDQQGFYVQAQNDLEAYQQKISVLRENIRDLENSRAALAHQVHQYQSLCSPIRRLPAEILLLIFEAYIETSAQEVYQFQPILGAVFTLAQVCSVWRNMAVSCPSLWSNVRFRPGFYVPVLRRKLSEVLDSSKTRPLHIDIHVGHSPENQIRSYINIQPSPLIFEPLLATANRSRIEKLWVSSYLDPFGGTFRQSFESLTDLSLDLASSVPHYSLPHTSYDWVPACSKLRTLRIAHGAGFPHLLTKIPVAQITTLEAKERSVHDGLSVIARFPRVQCATLSVRFHSQRSVLRLLTLPQIKRLRLQILAFPIYNGNPVHDTASPLTPLLDNLDTPSLESLTLEVDSGETDCLWFQASILTFMARCNALRHLHITSETFTGDSDENLLGVLEALPQLESLHLSIRRKVDTGDPMTTVTPMFLSRLKVSPDNPNNLLPRLTSFSLALAEMYFISTRMPSLVDMVESRMMDETSTARLERLCLVLDGDFADPMGVDALRRLEICRQNGLRITIQCGPNTPWASLAPKVKQERVPIS